MCTVSDYHEQGMFNVSLSECDELWHISSGNLSSYIEKQRAKREPIDEQVSRGVCSLVKRLFDALIYLQLLKMWVGQLAEGLCHAHTNEQLHRNLKPNNVLLSSSSSVLLGMFSCTYSQAVSEGYLQPGNKANMYCPTLMQGIAHTTLPSSIEFLQETLQCQLPWTTWWRSQRREEVDNPFHSACVYGLQMSIWLLKGLCGGCLQRSWLVGRGEEEVRNQMCGHLDVCY